jgi:hypothetical protein
VTLFDLQGRSLSTLHCGLFSAGEHALSLSTMTRENSVLANKTIFMRLQADYGNSSEQRVKAFYRSKKP